MSWYSLKISLSSTILFHDLYQRKPCRLYQFTILSFWFRSKVWIFIVRTQTLLEIFQITKNFLLYKSWATSKQNSLFLFAPIPSNFFILYWSWFYTHTVKCCRRWTGWVSRLQCWCGQIIRVAIQICHIGHSPLARG